MKRRTNASFLLLVLQPARCAALLWGVSALITRVSPLLFLHRVPRLYCYPQSPKAEGANGPHLGGTRTTGDVHPV